MKVVVVFGTRPDALKLAPVVRALEASPGVEVKTVSTGQHRDLAARFAAAIGLRTDVDLGIMQPNQSPNEITRAVLEQLPPVLRSEPPDVVVVQGDTTSAAAAALAAFHLSLPVAHVEAGLRTGRMDQPFPEEMNRRWISLVARLHLAPTETARSNLESEGVDPRCIALTGNPIVDELKRSEARARRPACAGPDGRHRILVTAHRRESWGEPLERIAGAVQTLAARADTTVIVARHPNPKARTPFDRLASGPEATVVEPLGHDEIAWLLPRCRFVLTDSGGLQEEAAALGTPVLVAREVTERPEILETGIGFLVGSDPDRIVSEASRLLDDEAAYAAAQGPRSVYGDGRAGERIADALRERFGGARGG